MKICLVVSPPSNKLLQVRQKFLFSSHTHRNTHTHKCTVSYISPSTHLIARSPFPQWMRASNKPDTNTIIKTNRSDIILVRFSQIYTPYVSSCDSTNVRKHACVCTSVTRKSDIRKYFNHRSDEVEEWNFERSSSCEILMRHTATPTMWVHCVKNVNGLVPITPPVSLLYRKTFPPCFKCLMKTNMVVYRLRQASTLYIFGALRFFFLTFGVRWGCPWARAKMW